MVWVGVAALGLLLAVGCEGEQEIRAYQAPKDPPAPVVPVAAQTPAGAAAKPTWTVPAGWKELPAQQMRYAAFAVAPDKPEVVLTVVPLGGASGGLAANVNRWEQQIGLPATPEAEIGKVTKHEDINDLHVDWVDLQGREGEAGKARQRILAAVIPHGGRTWFFKLMGPADVVEGQKANFDAFVRSVRFPAANDAAPGNAAAEHAAADTTPRVANAEPKPDHAPGPATAVPAAKPTKITWGALPAGWTAGPAAQPPRMATLKIEAAGQQAELAVTKFPGNAVGSFADNVNRWRGQLGLPPTEDVRQYVPKLQDLGGEQWAVVDIAGPEQRMLVGMATPAGGASGEIWFFKLQGPAKLVEQQRPAFEQFLGSVKFVAE